MTNEKANGDTARVFKTKYTKNEIEELLQWFEARKGALPPTLRLNASTVAADLPRAVAALTEIIKEHAGGANVFVNSYIAHLELIRRRLTEMGGE